MPVIAWYGAAALAAGLGIKFAADGLDESATAALKVAAVGGLALYGAKKAGLV